VAEIYKEFPGPSVDNPALLHQFAQALARRYAQMFPAARGFALDLKEYKVGKALRGWEILILHGFFAGARILSTPGRLTPQLITIRVSQDSRLHQRLTNIAAVLALLIMAPIFIMGILRVRVILALVLCAPILFVLAVVLSLIVNLICRLFRPLDHYFDENTQSRILAIAGEVPLPTTLDRSAFPVPPPPPPAPSPIPAYPTRRGPFGIKM
jgi:hypothetical protein